MYITRRDPSMQSTERPDQNENRNGYAEQPQQHITSHGSESPSRSFPAKPMRFPIKGSTILICRPIALHNLPGIGVQARASTGPKRLETSGFGCGASPRRELLRNPRVSLRTSRKKRIGRPPGPQTGPAISGPIVGSDFVCQRRRLGLRRFPTCCGRLRYWEFLSRCQRQLAASQASICRSASSFAMP